ALIDEQPVGVMIYNHAEIMGTPWETVLTLYRKDAAGRRFDSVEDYAADFFKFVDGNAQLFPQEQQELEYLRMVAFLFGAVAPEWDSEMRYLASSGQGNPREKAGDVFVQIVQEVHKLYQTQYDGSARADLSCFPTGIADRLKRKYKGEIEQIIDSLERYIA